VFLYEKSFAGQHVTELFSSGFAGGMTTSMRIWSWIGVLGLALMMSAVAPAAAQGNYEIQVYPGDALEPGHTMVELHSNFTSTS
jgi:hypothetical protein